MLVVLDNDYIVDGRVIKEIKILEKLDIDYRILCYDFGKEYEDSDKIIRIPRGHFIKYKLQAVVNTFPISNYIWKFYIKKVIKQFKPNFIHVHDLYMHPPVYSALKSLNLETPITLDLHENYPYAIKTYAFVNRGINSFIVRPDLWEKKEKNILERSNSIIVLDKHFGNSLKEKYNLSDSINLYEFPNYPDYEELDKREAIIDEVELTGKICLYFGVISEARGITKVIHGLESLFIDHKDINLLLIGPVNIAYKEEFGELLSKNRNRIQHIPWIKVTQLLNYLDKCYIGLAPFEINPQIESGVANKIFQYLYGGLPIVASNAKPMANLINSGNCGVIYKSDDEIADAISYLYHNESIRDEMASNAKSIIKNDYSKEKFEKVFRNLYLNNN